MKRITTLVSFPVILGFHLFLLLTILLGGLYRFEENDDVLMMLISSGIWGAETSEYLVFINVLLGLLFKASNALLATYNSYLWFFLIATLLSHLSIIRSIRRLAGPEQFTKAYLLLVPILFHSVLFLQFTTLSYTLALAGLCCVVILISDSQSGWGTFVGALFFLGLSFLVRKEVAMVVAAFLLLFFLYFHFYHKKIALVRLGVFVGMLLLQFIILYTFDKSYYEKNGYSDFYSYNQIRGMLQDNPTPQVLQDCFLENGFTETAFLLFRNASLPYTAPDRLQAVLNCQRSQKLAAPLQHYLKRIPGDIYYFFYYSTPWSVYLLALPLLLIFAYNASLRPSLWYCLCSSLLLLLVILLEKNLKERVVFFLLHLPLVFIFFRSFLNKLPIHLPVWGIGLYLFVLTTYLGNSSLRTIENRRIYGRQFQQLQQLAVLEDKTLILAGRFSTPALPYLTYITGSSSRDVTDFSRVYISGWFSGSPTAQNFLQQRGAATFLVLLQSGRGVLLTDEPGLQKVLERYCQETYKIPLQLKTTHRDELEGLYFIQSR
ncbi:hypothetical protein [Cesiribacter andamanensis]|uniref:Glycosyltransferase RgtA/B/C/D-like domain-containing protein n=1 Tax=Cesiribacter andamanensis AMV16 TaxID=1279009 RepID=M7P116_9BACT|nr:hypothetical protein [Cesiribacter andamanensis]EMR04264.1 hypothetical protein ADICEAN_00550 [Cesiribacter andamanensis AMV16]